MLLVPGLHGSVFVWFGFCPLPEYVLSVMRHQSFKIRGFRHYWECVMNINEMPTDASGNKFVEVLVNIPQLSSVLGPPELRNLRRVNKDVKDAVDQPTVWRVQFAKILKIAPRQLPGPLLPDQTNPFKNLYDGIEIAKHCAATGKYPNRDQDLLIVSSFSYLQQHFPESASNLKYIVEGFRRTRAQGRQAPHLKTELGKLGLLVIGGGALASLLALCIVCWQPQMESLKARNSAKYVEILSSERFAIFAYSVYGFGVMVCLGAQCAGLHYTVGLLAHAKRHRLEWDRNMLRLKSEELVADNPE
jgi:hypothetical protein